MQLCDRSDVNSNKNTLSIICKYYATLFEYTVPHSYDSQEVAQGHVTEREKPGSKQVLRLQRGTSGTLHASSLPAANRQGMTGPLTLAVGAKL